MESIESSMEKLNFGVFPKINYEKKSSQEGDDMIKSMQDNQLKSLKNAIEDLKILVNERERLNGSIFEDIERLKIEINNFILEAGSEVETKDKLELRKKIIEIEEIKLQEKLNSWRDIALLKKELRERMQDHEDKSTRLKALNEILEE